VTVKHKSVRKGLAAVGVTKEQMAQACRQIEKLRQTMQNSKEIVRAACRIKARRDNRYVGLVIVKNGGPWDYQFTSAPGPKDRPLISVT